MSKKKKPDVEGAMAYLEQAFPERWGAQPELSDEEIKRIALRQMLEKFRSIKALLNPEQQKKLEEILAEYESRNLPKEVRND